MTEYGALTRRTGGIEVFVTTDKGVDGAVELVAVLDQMSDTSPIAFDAPRSAALYRYLSEGMRAGPKAEEFRDLAIELIQRLGIWWSPEIYATLPVMVPWCIRDRACRYDQGPESWGSPRSDGYLRDDNSIIKKLPLPLPISGPEGSAYRGRKPWRGFTACHIWRDLPSGKLAGADPWLYSFVPNLIWLPTWLAPLTDRQGDNTQVVLQRTSIALFRGVELRGPVTGYAEAAWAKLPSPPPGPGLALETLNKFDAVPSYLTRRLNSLDKFVKGCDEILAGHQIKQKLVCTRYTEELPKLDRRNVKQFRDTMEDYRQACAAALHASCEDDMA
ncbi:hypothetical protein [Mycolicibacter algericus]|uniref:Uncharacterized protein n=1 Tax=Mycolicibacter algericus DSM 45454 TaxID=723879 RepID=A0ABX3RC69_MYCAL|nr:hypothetical protein [Mycolicibacter algericus]OQZ91492.1 hypothetical protein BST10_21915 [Mycolicibacter algericus DSM 45454]